MTTLKALAAALRPRYEETRVLGEAEIIGVRGSVGGVFADLSIRLSLDRLSLPAKMAAIDLRDAGCIITDDRGALSLGRLPANAVERRLLRECLGLQHQRGDV